MYGIKVSYPWGDQEEGLYGDYKTKEEAYKGMCELACKEAYVQNEEFAEDRTCSIEFDAYHKKSICITHTITASATTESKERERKERETICQTCVQQRSPFDVMTGNYLNGSMKKLKS